MTTDTDLIRENNQEGLQVRDFKVGDRVRVIAQKDPAFGDEGMIDEIVPVADYPLRITGAGVEHLKYWCKPDELELIDTPAPDVVAQYPADGHPEHYTAGLPVGVAAVDVIKAHLKAGGAWDTANALKYILRHPLKENPTQDIKKAIRCLNMWVAEQEAAA